MAVIGLWISAGILTGFAHWLELLVAQNVFGRMAWFSREFVWMSPIAYTLVMAPGAVLLAALTAIVRRTWMFSFTAFALVAVGVFGLLLPYSQISRLSSLILALGAGVAFSRSVAAQPDRWMLRSSRLGAFSVALLAVVTAGQRLVASRGAPANAVEPESGAANTLVIILDTVRAASMGLYNGTEGNTPFLAEWSRSSTVFDWAFSPAPWTLPSHASMFTGAYAGDQTGDWLVPLNDERLTLAEWFRRRGYHTAGFVANMHYTAWDSGLERGFDHYDDYVIGVEQLWRSSSYTQTVMFGQLQRARSVRAVWNALRAPDLSISFKHEFQVKRGNVVTNDFLDWHAAHGDRPFFAFLNYFDAHQPYYAPPEFQHYSVGPGSRGQGHYRAAIAFLDSEINRILVTLRDRGVLDNTLVVVTSDHGELFAFKGLNGHAHNVYPNTIRVPLVLRYPGHVPAGQRSATAVTLRDLPATIAALIGRDSATFPGASLASAWTATPAVSPVLVEVSRATNVSASFPTARGDLRSLLDDRWQLIVNGDGQVEFYEYRTDSLLVRNLADADSLAADRIRLQQRLADLLGARR